MAGWVEPSPTAGRSPGRQVWWLALIILVLNDHFLKGSGWLPAAWTGKLSDVAGLIVAPPALARLLGARGLRARLACVLATGAVFTVVNLSAEAARAVEGLTAAFGLPWRLWPDPTDLLALPALYVAWRLLAGENIARGKAGDSDASFASALHGASAALAGLACLATSYVPPRNPEEVQSSEAAKLFVMGRWTSQVFAIDPRTGTILHSRELNDVPHTSWVATDDTLYFANGDDGVRAIALRSARERFTTTIHCRHCPVRLTLGGKQLFASIIHRRMDGGTGWVFAIDRTSGKVAWYVQVADLTSFSPSESDRAVFHRDHLLLPTHGGLASLAAATGAIEMLGPKARIEWLKVDEGTAYFVARDGEDAELVELDLESQRVTWRRPIHAPYEPVRYAGDAVGLSQGTLIYAEERDLVALDPSTRQLLWRHPHAGELAVGPNMVMVAGRRFEPPFDPCYIALDPRTGQRAWSVDCVDDPHEPTFVNGLLLLRERTTLRAYAPEDGRSLWTVDLRGSL